MQVRDRTSSNDFDRGSLPPPTAVNPDKVLEAQGDYEEDVWRLVVRENVLYYLDGTRDRRGRVMFQASEMLVTLTEGRPRM